MQKALQDYFLFGRKYMKSDELQEKTDTLFCQIALQLKLVNKAQVKEALRMQQEILRTVNVRKPLGLIFVEKGFIDEVGLHKILETQKESLAKQNRQSREVRQDDLFGKIAIRLGFATEDVLEQCLKYQEKIKDTLFMRIGEILVQKGYMIGKQVQEVLAYQEGFVVLCSQCNTKYNFVMFKPGSVILCYKCETHITVPGKIEEEPPKNTPDTDIIYI